MGIYEIIQIIGSCFLVIGNGLLGVHVIKSHFKKSKKLTRKQKKEILASYVNVVKDIKE